MWLMFNGINFVGEEIFFEGFIKFLKEVLFVVFLNGCFNCFLVFFLVGKFDDEFKVV